MLSDVYFPRINGVSTSIETFRRDLGGSDIRVTLVAPAYEEHPGGEDVLRVRARRLPFDPEDRLMVWRSLRRKVDEACREPVDLIHIQTPFAAHYAGVGAARRLGRPVVATYHTHFEEYIGHYLPVLPRPLLRATARGIARGQCNGLDAVIVPSRAMEQTLQGYGVTAATHVLPTGIPIERFNGGDRGRFRTRHDIAEHRPVALFVGRVAHEKNIDFLLRAVAIAARAMPELLLVVAGEGPALPSLLRQAASLGIEGNVRFIGYMDRSTELPDCYAGADAFAFASRTETQGLVLLEAMAAGLPVYAFAAMGTRDIVEPGRGAIAAAQHEAGFADGLVRLLRDPALRARMAVEGSCFANDWSAPERARQLAHLYRSLKR
ncbi:MAG TPA: glycosyltransferase [Rhodocyclaceae bacterium]